MKTWTQEAFQMQKSSLKTGFVEFETGDFRQVKEWRVQTGRREFYPRHRVEIGEGSILGENVILGDYCRIGHNVTQMGSGLDLGPMAMIGHGCTFGANAHVREGSRIGSGVIFCGPCVIDKGVELGDDIRFPENCKLFGVEEADGKSLIKISPVEGRHLYAFTGRSEEGGRCVYVAMPGMLRTLAEFTEFSINLCSSKEIGKPMGFEMFEAAKFLEVRFRRFQRK